MNNPGNSHIDMVYVGSCLMKFGISMDGFHTTQEHKLYKLGAFKRNMIIKSTKFRQNWVVCYQNYIGVIGQKIGIQKVKFLSLAGTSSNDSGESNPLPTVRYIN